MLGLNQSVRNTPVSRSTTKLHSAISPSMNDQWSGKTLRICFLAPVAMPTRSSAQLATAPTLDGLAGVLAFLAARGVILMRQPRSQKLGPTGALKSLVAIR